MTKERDAVPVEGAEEVKVAIKLGNGCVVLVVESKVEDGGILDDTRRIYGLGKNHSPTLHAPFNRNLRNRLLVLLGNGH